MNELTESHALLNTYKRAAVKFVRGEGAKLYDSQGKEYLDFLAGLAVVSLAHAHPQVTAAIKDQAAKLLHVSNLYWTEPMMMLSQRLSQISGGGFNVFFCNSGSEAVECAIKFARKAAGDQRFEIVCAKQGFHGRTLGALAATGQPAKWKGFEPLPQGFQHAEFNNLESFTAALNDQTAAVLLEPIQGEAGVFPAETDFLRGIQEICSQRGILLIFDEIQSGCGRSGNWWAWQHYGVRPDIFVVAKGLANGLPIGACLVDQKLAHHFQPGDHGSTFGGGPLPARAAFATLAALEAEQLVSQAAEKSRFLVEQLEQIPGIKNVRGIGLLIAAQLESNISALLTERVLQNGLVVNSVCPDAIRIAPPLCISREEIAKGVKIIRETLAALTAELSINS